MIKLLVSAAQSTGMQQLLIAGQSLGAGRKSIALNCPNISILQSWSGIGPKPSPPAAVEISGYFL
jgi:hypothetical protein